jgi:hypothetical protein
MRLARTAILAALLVSMVTACGGDSASPGDTSESRTTTTAPTTSTSTTPTTTTTTPTTSTTAEAPPVTEPADTEPVGEGAEALAFFRSTEPICVDHAEEYGNPRPQPEQFADASVVEELEPGVWLIVDGHDQELIVDLVLEAVYSTDGPDWYLPFEYSFGCPPDLYLGSAHD